MVCLLLPWVAVTLLIEVDKDIVQRVMNKLNVGNTNIYRPMPSSLILLVKNIFKIMARALVTAPPIIKIIVDFINLFFIVNYMF